jgi:Papain family cysteine protease
MNFKNFTLLAYCLLLGGISTAGAQTTTISAANTDDSVLDLRPYFGPVKAQMDRNSCATFAILGALEYSYYQLYNQKVDFSEQYNLYTLYHNTKAKVEESSVDDCKDIIKQYGLLQESDWPYNNSYFLRGYPCYSQTYGAKSSDYECYTHKLKEQNIQSKTVPAKIKGADIYGGYKRIIEALKDYKSPLIFYFPQVGDNWSESGEIIMNDSIYKSQPVYYHIALLCGYDLRKRVFFVRNSWGNDWGQNGYGTLSFDLYNKYANSPSVLYRLVKSKELENITITPTIKPTFNNVSITYQGNIDSGIKVLLSGEIDSLGYRTVEVRSIFLVTNTETGTENMKEVTIPKDEIPGYRDMYARVVQVHLGDSNFISQFHLGSLNGEALTYPKEVLQSPSFQQLLENPANKLQLKTSIYIMGDAWGYQHYYRLIQDVDPALLRKP